MLLRDDLRYIVLDTETTGLDKKHDEITQIAIVEYTAQGQEVQRFSSYVKPSANKIQDVVSIITGIQIETLEAAPTRHEIRPTIQHFFSEKTIIIGHSIGFDMAFLERYCTPIYHTIIDTLPFTQALFPYQPSYALEIIAQNILDPHEIPSNEYHNFHDALTDVLANGVLFFTLLKKLESLLYTYPYLREIFKRTGDGIGIALAYKQDQQFLLEEVPVLSAAVRKESKNNKDLMPLGNGYIGETSLETILKNIPIEKNCIAFSHHPKALLAQKMYATFGVLTALHEQTPFDTDLLLRFFTKKSYQIREAYCAIKYFLHAKENHSTFHVANPSDALFLQACRLPTTRIMRKKIFTHYDIFEAVANGNISRDQIITIFDKERLFDNWKKWKHKPYDLYNFATLLDATIYKYTLLKKDTVDLQKLSSSFLIFIGFFSEESDKLYKDVQQTIQSRVGSKTQDESKTPGEPTSTTTPENFTVPIDNYFANTYFFKSSHIWENMQQYLKKCNNICDPHDISILEKELEKIDAILKNPFSLTRKRSAYQTRFTIQSVDTFVEPSEIEHFFETYQLRILSVLDPRLPYIEKLVDGTSLPKDKSSVIIQKRKDISLNTGGRVCIIAPGKAAAQQLLLSLHKSNLYKDYFLAAEQVTGGSGKIIQQTLGKTSYILIGSYNFCIQCVANGIKFDSIGALDIINTGGINPFTDLGYYVAEKKHE